jgi:Tfp pilus assembly protein PilF
MIVRKLPQVSDKRLIPKIEIKKKAAQFQKNIQSQKIAFKKREGKNQKKKIEKLIEKANLYLKQKKYQKAEENYIKTIKYDPKSVKAYNGLGVIYLEQKNYSHALQSFSKAVKIDPENALSYNNLGLVLYNQGEYKKAVQAFCKSVDLQKNAPRCINLGLAYWAAGQEEKAIQSYQEGLTFDPNNIEYLTTLASALLKTNKKSQAKKILKKILKLNPKNIEAKRELVRIK